MPKILIFIKHKQFLDQNLFVTVSNFIFQRKTMTLLLLEKQNRTAGHQQIGRSSLKTIKGTILSPQSMYFDKKID